MKLLRGNPSPEMKLAVAACVAHRCDAHKELPPMNANEGNGSSECGGCVAEEMGTRFAEEALFIQEQKILNPILEGYADRLEYGCRLRNALERARTWMTLSSMDVSFIDEALNGDL